MTKTSTLNLRINDELKDFLQVIAISNNVNISDVVRDILEESMENSISNEAIYGILTRRAEKLTEALKKDEWVYIIGDNSVIEIAYDDFKVDVVMFTDNPNVPGIPTLELALYKNKSLVFKTSFNDKVKIDTNKTIYISNI